jgi:DNA-binding NarL/FixJ family response regulator
MGRLERQAAIVTGQQLESLSLTEREAQVLDLVARGRSNAEIAGELNVAPGTVKKHSDNIFEKLGVRNRVGAACIWISTSSGQSPDELGIARSPANDLVA